VRRKGVPDFSSQLGWGQLDRAPIGKATGSATASRFPAVAEVGLLSCSKLQILKSIIRVASKASLPLCWSFF
jgi:hypothetical protein